MKYCEDYVAALSAFADGELSGGEADVLRAHLASCPGCRAYLADLRAMQAAFPQIEDAPADFAAGVMARIHGGTTAKKPRRRLYPLLGAVAACLVLLVAVGLFPAPPTAPSAAPPQAAQVAPRMRDTANEFAAADSAAAPESAPAPADTAPVDSSPAPADSIPAPESAAAPVTAPSNPGETAVGIAGGSAPMDAAPPMVQAAAQPLYFATLDLTAAQAGELLLGYTALPAPEGVLRYELPRDAFDALLAALPDVAYTPGDENATLALVTVTAGT